MTSISYLKKVLAPHHMREHKNKYPAQSRSVLRGIGAYSQVF